MIPIHNKYPAIVGAFIFFGIAILAAGIFMLGSQRNSFEQKFPVKAVFDDVGGLKVGDNVWLSGVKIGIISKIDFTDDADVLVTMNIEKKVNGLIHKDSKAKIGSDGLIGNRIIIIYGGTKGSLSIAANDYLGFDKTPGTKDMLAVLDSSNRNLLEITNNLKGISNKVLTGRGTLATLLNDSVLPENISHSVADLKMTMSGFRTTASGSKKVMNNLVDFSSRLNQRGTLINDLVTDTVVFNNLGAGVAQLRETTNKLLAFSDNLKKASEALNQNNTTAAVLLHDAQAAKQLKSMISNLDSASNKLKEDLEAVQHNFLFRGYFRKKARKANP